MRLVKALAAGLTYTLFNVSSSVADDEVGIMSFNVRTSIANDPCPSGCWDVRKERVKKLIEKYKPDIIGVQEAAPDQTAFFQNVLGFAATGECSGECLYNERNSIFFVEARWELLSTSSYALSATPETLPSNTWSLEFLRSAVIARLRDKKTSRVICMLNTHFDISRGQPQSAVLSAKLLSKFCQHDDTVIMTGDLNTAPSSLAVQYLLGKTSINGMSTPISLYETLTAAGAGGSTWIGPSFGNMLVSDKIDYIFARRDAHTCLRSGMVLADLFDGYSSSDHAVLLSKFCLGGECQKCIP
ncbi:hypothetical protein KXD40_000131 [Peronospora effusa]|uniref:Endonuclease/exonuclease/phosphatase domain-containing protein n=1 Tax=Peronospora effusa TaxID=542832 RepID=A0A3M6VPR5_9STRA|nr:hypothetical protein DD238_006294 [Peronospora effusa]RQM14809.1 hypothetical protein DD237_006179 [Peronospora effusa]RQM14819.1 hypothetical protein DD237_006182 [Peronospora effusa]UIZ21397.1 hypothetical protein KXD40_000131 [Peronospora effusa]CAI5705249.1 unnamed protein product [Peronospora effusa]